MGCVDRYTFEIRFKNESGQSGIFALIKRDNKEYYLSVKKRLMLACGLEEDERLSESLKSVVIGSKPKWLWIDTVGNRKYRVDDYSILYWMGEFLKECENLFGK